MFAGNQLELARSIRPQLTILPWTSYAVVILAHKGLAAADLLVGAGLFVAVYGVVVIQNDLADEVIDKANKRSDIPLASGLVSTKQLSGLMLGLTLVAIILGSVLGNAVLLWVAGYTLLGWLYSGPANLKGKGVFALAVLGLCYGLLPWVLGVLVAHVRLDAPTIAAALASFVFAAGITALKDYKDLAGDKAAGKNTLLLLHGTWFLQNFVCVATALAYLAVVTLLFFAKQYVGAGIGLTLMIYSLNIVASNQIALSAKFRGRNGKLIRLLFYAYTGLGYLSLY